MNNFWQKLPKPFTALAPMENVTNEVFRKLLAKTAPPDVFFTEFTSAEGLVFNTKRVVDMALGYSTAERPIVAQLWGINPESFYKAAKIIEKLGFDGIDINMGCPVRAIVKRGAGAALIKTPELAAQIILACKKGVKKIPVSVKTRLGYNKINTEEWLGYLLKQNIAALTVHGRIAVEMSKYPADWAEIGKVVELKNKLSPNTVIIGNGDIENINEVIKMSQKYKVDGVMIGRGIFKNPWIFEETERKYSKQEYIALLKNHLRLHEVKYKKQPKMFETIKKFFKMYIREFKGSAELRQKLMKCRSYSEVTFL
jgi:nifR3 family TIM-barrel protein